MSQVLVLVAKMKKKHKKKTDRLVAVVAFIRSGCQVASQGRPLPAPPPRGLQPLKPSEAPQADDTQTWPHLSATVIPSRAEKRPTAAGERRHAEVRFRVRRPQVPTLQLRLFPEVVKALEAPRVLECQLVAKVPEEEGHEDDEESDGSQKAQHLWRDWDRANSGWRKLLALL